MDPHIAAKLIWAVVFGFICARMARKRFRSVGGWALGGAAFGLLTVGLLWLLPSLSKPEVETKNEVAPSGQRKSPPAGWSKLPETAWR